MLANGIRPFEQDFRQLQIHYAVLAAATELLLPPQMEMGRTNPLLPGFSLVFLRTKRTDPSWPRSCRR